MDARFDLVDGLTEQIPHILGNSFEEMLRWLAAQQCLVHDRDERSGVAPVTGGGAGGAHGRCWRRSWLGVAIREHDHPRRQEGEGGVGTVDDILNGLVINLSIRQHHA